LPLDVGCFRGKNADSGIWGDAAGRAAGRLRMMAPTSFLKRKKLSLRDKAV
jgi:hypothetical protein